MVDAIERTEAAAGETHPAAPPPIVIRTRVVVGPRVMTAARKVLAAMTEDQIDSLRAKAVWNDHDENDERYELTLKYPEGLETAPISKSEGKAKPRVHQRKVLGSVAYALASALTQDESERERLVEEWRMPADRHKPVGDVWRIRNLPLS